MTDPDLFNINAQLYIKLAADAFVSATVVSRIYPDIAPEGAALPYITYSDISTDHTYHMGGDCDLTRNHVIQISCWADDPRDAELLSGYVRDVISGARATWNTIEVLRCHIRSNVREFVPADDGSETGTWRYRIEAEFDYRDAA